jgi:hypothetical protein
MKKSRFTEEQIIGIVKQQHGDILWLEVEVWRHGRERSARLRRTENGNQRLKALVADLSLGREMLKSVIRKNGWSLPA